MSDQPNHNSVRQGVQPEGWSNPDSGSTGPTGPTGPVTPLDGPAVPGTVFNKLGANPKDAIGNTKCPASYLPAPALYMVGLAMMEGAIKYGQMNWRDSAVDNRVYCDAAKRHIDRYWNGQTTDPKTRVHEIGYAIAGLLVMLDADLTGNLIDTRPTPVPEGWLEELAKLVPGVQAFAQEELERRRATQAK